MIVRGTTPTHTFTLPFNAANAKTVRVIYSQEGKETFVKTGDDLTVEDNTVSVKLTQEETLKFDCTMLVEIQVRVLSKGGDAVASDILKVAVSRCLEDEVI